MPREKEGFRANLERLDAAFPGRELLRRKDLCEYTGLSRHGLSNNFPFTGMYISKADFARMISKGQH